MMDVIVTRLRDNWKSGLAVALINIPLSVSLAVASLGSQSASAPLVGILTAIWGGLAASLFASSKHNIFGPAGALSGILIVFSLSVGPQYVPFVAILTGLIILAMWGLRIAKYVTLLPSSVLHGFLLAVAVTIASGQLNGAFGLVGLTSHKEYAENLWETLSHLGNASVVSVTVFVAFFVFLQLWKRFVPKVPGPLPAAVLGIAVGYAASKGFVLPAIPTLHDKFPSLSFALALPPTPAALGIDLSGGALAWLSAHTDVVKAIVSTSVVVAVIAVLETLIAGKIAEKITKVGFDKDIEVRGTGIANIVSGLLGGMPATAVLVRTALNAKSGANHRVSAFLAAVFTLLISVALFSWFTYLPIPVVAAILVNIAVGMVEVGVYGKMWRYDRAAFVITFLVAAVCVFDDPMHGVIVGTLVSLILFVIKLSDWDMEISVFRKGEFVAKRRFSEYLPEQSADDTILYKFAGSLNFLNVSKQIERIQRIEKAKAVIFTFSHIASLDIDGIEALEEQIEHLRQRGIEVVFCGLSGSTEKIVSRTHLYAELANTNRVFDSSARAIEAIA